ncbi:hypothetical protein DFH07DRAFT_779493 [Mycena maculata]|uniref:Uncharacterized protein n=1 Tax=Mycena maculata TaxID=230809 RepID=A0AAD7I953_9AGAR|nr:hypothetical protein DFH07DRAFT_779493 [Mycena maculata]
MTGSPSHFLFLSLADLDAVSFLFHTMGQVLNVSLSGALMQTLFVCVSGKGANNIIASHTLPPDLQEKATTSWTFNHPRGLLEVMIDNVKAKIQGKLVFAGTQLEDDTPSPTTTAAHHLISVPQRVGIKEREMKRQCLCIRVFFDPLDPTCHSDTDVPFFFASLPTSDAPPSPLPST